MAILPVVRHRRAGGSHRHRTGRRGRPAAERRPPGPVPRRTAAPAALRAVRAVRTGRRQTRGRTRDRRPLGAGVPRADPQRLPRGEGRDAVPAERTVTAERHAGGTVTAERAAPASPGNGSPASGAPSAPPRTPDPDFVRPGARVAAVTAGVEDPRPVLAALLPEAKVGHADIDELSANPPAVAEPYAVALVARTPTDLRRLVSVGEMLPAADRIMVAILETPSWLDTPQVTLARGMGQRRLREMRVVRLGATGWLITTRFNRELGAGEVAAGVARGMTGHHLNAYPLPAFGLGD